MLKLAGQVIENSIKKKGLPNRRTFLKMLGAGVGIGAAAALTGIRLEEDVMTGRRVIVIGSNKVMAAGVADYVCNGVQDDVQLQAALDALPSIGGKLIVLAGTYNFTATVLRAIDNVIIEGVGFGTLFNNDGATALFSAGSQDGWAFRDLATDDGGISYGSATRFTMQNVLLGSTYWETYPSSLGSLLTTQGDILTRDASAPKRLGIGTEGYYLKAGADEPEWAVVGGAADFPMKLKPALTRHGIPGWYIANNSGQAYTADRIYYIPIFVVETTTYIRISIYVISSSVGNADLRIFNWADGVPGSLVLSAGTVDTGSTGEKEIVISEELTRGYYFLAIRCTGTPSLSGALTDRAVSTPCGGFLQVGGQGTNNIILTVDEAYDDPAPAPTDKTTAKFASITLREN